MKNISYGIHWFRRDLRVLGNPALIEQFQRNQQNVLGIFCFDHKFLSRSDFSVNRFQLFLETLASLKKDLMAMGSDLLVLDIGPQDAFQMLINQLKKHELPMPQNISWCRDYEPFALKRDQRMKKFFEQEKIAHFNHRDHLLIEPDELLNQKSEPYKVFTPFAKKWCELMATDEIQKRISSQKASLKKAGQQQKIFKLTWKKLFQNKVEIKDHLQDYLEDNAKKVNISIPKTGTQVALNQLKSFSRNLDQYENDRDFPAIHGTSKLSMYLKNGTINSTHIIANLGLKPYVKKQTSRDCFLSEIIWREFYYHILYHFPYVEKKAFNPKYQKLQWDNNKKYFQHWKDGTTGFPIVDAGMRELKQTGWMHNRVRMIVASFLVKDLLIDWRLGERYFMETLLDGDLAPNNGGWQWAASTGCDAQPYFRIFNPWLQSKKFDPQGEYIKKYIPELKDLDYKKLHQPILNHPHYPNPIVEHKIQRQLALDIFTSV